MARVLRQFELTANMLGEGNAQRKRVFEIAVSGAATEADAYADALNAADAILNAYNNVTDGEIVGFSLRGIHVEDTAVAVPTNGNIYTEALLTVGLDAPGFKKGSFIIQAPKASIYVGDDPASGEIDGTDATIVALLAAFKAPNLGRVSDDEQVLSNPPVRKARLRSVGSGKDF